MKPFWTFKAKAADKGELNLYGPISSASWWGDEVTPKQFSDDLKALGDISQLDVYINSEGGDVFAGQAIYSMLRRHKAHKTVYVDGLAASIASVVAMAGDEVIMPRNAMMMIHNPWMFAFGGYNAESLRKAADDLDSIRESLIVTYEDKTHLSREEIVAMMDEETWLTAEQAKEKGFADDVEAEKQVAASMMNGKLVVNGQEMDVSRYHLPDKFAEVVQEPAPAEDDTDAQERERNALNVRRLHLLLDIDTRGKSHGS